MPQKGTSRLSNEYGYHAVVAGCMRCSVERHHGRVNVAGNWPPALCAVHDIIGHVVPGDMNPIIEEAP